MTTNSIGKVLSCAPQAIIVDITDLHTFEACKEHLQIGRYLRIELGNRDSTIAVIKNIKGIVDDKEETPVWSFTIECQPIGSMCESGEFIRGSVLLPVPTEPVYLASTDVLNSIFVGSEDFNFKLGKLSVNKDIDLMVNGDCLFSKHIAIVGSTGSGKSCTVARILQDIVGIEDGGYRNKNNQNNSHIVIFDIHDEYSSAFSLNVEHNYNLNRLDIDTLKLPYWLMNSEELESIFIESNEANSHNQISQFKQAVILNKEKYNPDVLDVNYDTPVYFSINEVYQYIDNLNREVIGRLSGEDVPKLETEELVTNRGDLYFTDKCLFVSPSTAKDSKATNGPFNGEFNRFVSRLETKLNDKRLRFLLDPRKEDNTGYKTEDFSDIVKQFLGYMNRSNISIIDLSGIPFEMLSICISLVSRLIFDFCFHYTKLRHLSSEINDIPVMIVCEEAHNYIPQSNEALYKASRKSIERIAKEGRKYGLSLMIVSQRPSEVSSTIFAQCNNYIALRLTNDTDQQYVKRLFPDNSSAITDILPNLSPGECIIVGDAVVLPAIIQMPLPNPEPQSQSVKVMKEWMENWKDITFEDVIKRWRKDRSTEE